MGKRIDQLDPYGSVNFDKRRKDLFEISKNDGTYLDPEYLPGGSRKITQEELELMLGYLPLVGARYNIVTALSGGVENGTRFAVAYAEAAAKAIDANNRSVVYVYPGYYDIQEKIRLSEFVDIYGVGRPEDIYFDSNYFQDCIFEILDTNLDYSISNITIANNGNPTEFSIKHAAGITDSGIWDNIILQAKTSDSIWDGNYDRIKGVVDKVMQGSIGPTGSVLNSIFKNKSCGYSETSNVTIEGSIFNSYGIDYCFGHSVNGASDISGIIEKSKGRDYCFSSSNFGTGTDISGKIKNCQGRNYCFSATSSNTVTVDITGSVDNCEAFSNSFSFSPIIANRLISGNGVCNCKYGSINGIVNSSPNGKKWRKTLGNDGEWQTEDLGI